MASRHLKTTLFNFSEELECPQFPKLRLLRCQNFLKVFSPSVLLGSACGAWPLGHNFPRQHTAALRSLGGPRCGPRAAHRGQGGSGCEDQRRPWPRTKDLGTENPLEAMGFLREEVNEMLMVQVVLDAWLFCGKCFAETFGTEILCFYFSS